MKHQYALGLLLAMSVVPSVSAIKAAEPSSVVISEIAWAGSEKSTADEWIEIRNTGTEALDISGWSLTGIGTGGSAIAIPGATSISAGSAYLVANYSLTDPKTTLVVQPSLVTTALSIPNTSLNVALLDSTGTTIDSLVDPGTPNFGSSTTFSTMKRDLSSKAWFAEEASTNVSHTIAAESDTPTESTTATPAATDITPPVVTIADPVVGEVAFPSINDTSPVVAEAITSITEPIAPLSMDASVAPDVIVMRTEILISEPSANEPPVAPVSEETVSVIVPELAEATTEVTAPEIVVAEVPIVTVEELTIDSQVTKALRITGLLSSPNTGNDEWIELTNVSPTPVVLDTFTLVDASGKITALSGVLDAGATQRILNPNGNLNNDGDSVTLMNADAVVDSLVYGTDTLPAPKKDAAILLVNDEWVIQNASSTAPSTETEATPATIENTPTEATPATDLIIATPEITTPIISSQTPSSAPTSSSVGKGDVVINEVLPSPSTGYDEWVELKNMKDTSILLDGLSLVDASGKETHLSGAIDAGGYTLIPNPTGNLNNDIESIALMNGGGVLDSISYGNETYAAPKKDIALARMNGEWAMTTPTPGTENSNTQTSIETLTPTLSPTLYANSTTTIPEQTAVTTNADEPAGSSGTRSAVARHVVTAVKNITTTDSATATASVKTAPASSKTSTAPKIPKSTTSTTKKSSTSTTSSVRSATVDDIASIADGTQVKLEGIVVATTGLVGKRSFFLNGLEVYQSNGALADVKIGDRVSITGEVSVLSDHRRVNIQEGTTRVIDHGAPVTHDYAPTLPYGSLARITGTVSARDGNAVLLSTDHGTITLVPGNGVAITWADLAGATITATGILKHGNQETIVLRSNDDVVTQQNGEPISAATFAGTTASQSSMLWMTGVLLAASSAGFGAWVWYTRPKARLSKLILHPTNV